MKYKGILLLATVLVAVLAFAGCSSITGGTTTTSPPVETTPRPSVEVAPRVGKIAPGFQLEDFKGSTVSLDSLRGKYVMLNFWATWCRPCRAEMPFFQEIYEEGVWEEKGLVIIAVNVGESAEQAQDFMDTMGFEFRVLLDSTTQTASMYNIRGIPTTFFVGDDGIIKDISVGTFRNKVEIESILQNLVGD